MHHTDRQRSDSQGKDQTGKRILAASQSRSDQHHHRDRLPQGDQVEESPAPVGHVRM